MTCVINPERPCSARSRAKNKYSRAELNAMAKDCQIKGYKAMSIDELCVALKNNKKFVHVDMDSKRSVKAALSPPAPKGAKMIEVPKPRGAPVEVMFEAFKQFFREDLIGFLQEGGPKTPRFRVFTAGGYGLKTLLETKHAMHGKVSTTDMDFTVSTYRSSMTPEACYQHWTRRLLEFFQTQMDPSVFQVKSFNFGHAYTPILNYHRDYVISVTFQGGDFVDIAITNFKITNELMDRRASLTAGIPLKKEHGYLKEFLAMIYMENVPGVNDFAYKKRNPIHGDLSNKGEKDINRAQIICKIRDRHKYKKYCELLKSLTLKKLGEMPLDKRNMYFNDLKHIISPGLPLPPTPVPSKDTVVSKPIEKL